MLALTKESRLTRPSILGGIGFFDVNEQIVLAEFHLHRVLRSVGREFCVGSAALRSSALLCKASVNIAYSWAMGAPSRPSSMVFLSLVLERGENSALGRRSWAGDVGDYSRLVRDVFDDLLLGLFVDSLLRGRLGRARHGGNRRDFAEVV